MLISLVQLIGVTLLRNCGGFIFNLYLGADCLEFYYEFNSEQRTGKILYATITYNNLVCELPEDIRFIDQGASSCF